MNSETTPPLCLWILNGCGVVNDSVTGGPTRFHEISKRWKRTGIADQQLATTCGGATMLRRMGCDLPITLVPASLFLHHEPVRALRLWSYIISATTADSRLARLPAAPDAIITASDYFCDIRPSVQLKRRNPRSPWIACVYHKETHPSARPGNYMANAITWKMQEWSLARIARHADQVWLSANDAGDQVEKRLAELGMAQNRSRRVQNGIDLQAIRNVPPQAPAADAVMVGVRPNKGMHDIVPVWSEVQRLRPGTTLRLMGGMSGEGPTIETIRKAGLADCIQVIRPASGYLPPSAYYGKIKESRLMFAPSHEEGWGIAVCEAMACGLPVVAYDLPTYRAIFGDALTLVPCFDAPTFARLIVELLENPQRYAAQARAGREVAEQFGWDRIAEEDGEAFLRLVRERGGTSS
jgi:glycosyltransferase involved in cell wall biosynthesis